MRQYLQLLSYVLAKGVDKPDRTGTGTRSIFGYQMRFDLSDGFPLLTTKKLHLKSILHELLWMLKGDTNVKYLQDNGVHIWDEWADKWGDLGPVYGKQWRAWQGYRHEEYDQIVRLIENLHRDKESRRHLVTAWNVGAIDDMALPPCHLLFQCYVSNGRLSLQVYQRSADIFLGVPFNIASYALLTMMLAQVSGLEPGELIWTGGDCHLYQNHIEQAKLQLAREPRALPAMYIDRSVADIDGFRYEHFNLIGYEPWPHIAGKVAV